MTEPRERRMGSSARQRDEQDGREAGDRLDWIQAAQCPSPCDDSGAVIPPTAMLASSARAFWIVAPGRGEIRDEGIAPPGPDDVLVRAEFSGISRGTEALVFQGRVPVGEYHRMRAPFQSGDFPGPVKYGYSSVGCVEDG